MRCPECSADVSALREFCPICGAAMDPGVRGSLLGARAERPGERRKGGRKVILIGGILLALGAVGQLTWPWSSSTIGSHERNQIRGPVTFEAEQLH